MQAALVPLPSNPAQHQQQQQDACNAAENCGSSSSWNQLDVAIGFAPHLVYSASLPGWQPAPQQQQQDQVPAGIDGSGCGAAGAAAALLHGLRTVRAAHAGLGVYGALLVVRGEEQQQQAGGLQMLLGCFGKQ
jgi:hypothetical protein